MTPRQSQVEESIPYLLIPIAFCCTFVCWQDFLRFMFANLLTNMCQIPEKIPKYPEK